MQGMIYVLATFALAWCGLMAVTGVRCMATMLLYRRGQQGDTDSEWRACAVGPEVYCFCAKVHKPSAGKAVRCVETRLESRVSDCVECLI